MEWEMIDAYHMRCMVYGGWIVKAIEDVHHIFSTDGEGSTAATSGHDYRLAICFVPDPYHLWELTPEPKIMGGVELPAHILDNIPIGGGIK